MLPGIGVALPGLAAGFAGGGNGVSPPQLLACIRVKRIDMGAGALVAAAAADDYLVVDQQRRRGQRAVRFLGIVEYDSLEKLARIGLGPQDFAIACDGNYKVLVQGDAAV